MFTVQVPGKMGVAVASVGLVLVPESIREKLGEQATKDLVKLLNLTAKATKDNTIELMVERFEKRLAQVESRLTWRMFGFWVGQVVAVAGLMVAMFQFFLR